MTKTRLEPGLLLCTALAALWLGGGGCAPAPERFHSARPLMGTVVEITLYHPDQDRARELIDRAFAEMERIERLMSIRIAASEVARINREAYPGPIAVDREVFDLIGRALEAWRETSGAFDITVGPLMQLWPLYRAEKILPNDAQVGEALKRVGFDLLMLDPESSRIAFKKPGMSIDLGGIAKGYAIDRAIGVLRGGGVASALVNAGGDLYALGLKPDGTPWRVGVRHPRRPEELIATLEVHDIAIMTSGDYEHYFLKDGRRYSHIVDPRTGFTARGTAGVTLSAPIATWADALATGVLVLGPDAGLELVNRLPQVEAAILSEASEHRLKLTVSAGFAQVFRVDEGKLAY